MLLWNDIQQKDRLLSSSTLLPRSSTLQLLVKMTMREKCQVGHQVTRNKATKDTHEKGHPELLQKVARMIG